MKKSCVRECLKPIKSIIVVFAVIVFLPSCATILSGGAPSITINGNVNEPVDIITTKQVYQRVNLPVIVKVKRHKLEGQRIQITSENYKFNDIVLEKQVNSWAFGNILLGGLIGWGIDLATNSVVKPLQTHYMIQPTENKKNIPADTIPNPQERQSQGLQTYRDTVPNTIVHDEYNNSIVPQPKPQQYVGKYHTVQSGETITNIARRYGVTVRDIVKWNNLSTMTITSGMKLKVSAQ